MTDEFSPEAKEVRRKWQIFFKCWKETTVNPKFYTKWKHPQDHKVKINAFSDEGKQQNSLLVGLLLRNY